MTTTIEQLAAQYEDFSMDAKHRVLGEALYYLEVVESTHSIPGVEGVEIIPNMNMWCYPPPPYSNLTKSVQTCLAGIWYMGRTRELLVLRTVPKGIWLVLTYLNAVVKATRVYELYELVGLEASDDDYDNYTIIEDVDVQQRLQSLMECLPLMREAYEQLRGRPHTEDKP